jgi:hypothetical protein
MGMLQIEQRGSSNSGMPARHSSQTQRPRSPQPEHRGGYATSMICVSALRNRSRLDVATVRQLRDGKFGDDWIGAQAFLESLRRCLGVS